MVHSSSRLEETSPVLGTLLGDIQLFVDAPDGYQPDGPPDSTYVQSTLRNWLELGLVRRVMWNAGTCTLTDKRLIGVAYADPSDLHPSHELQHIPVAKVGTGTDGSILGTVLVFSIDREQFTSSAVASGGLLAKRVPFFQLCGNFSSFAMQPYRLINDGVEAKPGKGALAAIISRFRA